MIFWWFFRRYVCDDAVLSLMVTSMADIDFGLTITCLGNEFKGLFTMYEMTHDLSQWPFFWRCRFYCAGISLTEFFPFLILPRKIWKWQSCFYRTKERESGIYSKRKQPKKIMDLKQRSEDDQIKMDVSGWIPFRALRFDTGTLITPSAPSILWCLLIILLVLQPKFPSLTHPPTHPSLDERLKTKGKRDEDFFSLRFYRVVFPTEYIDCDSTLGFIYIERTRIWKRNVNIKLDSLWTHLKAMSLSLSLQNKRILSKWQKCEESLITWIPRV